MKKQILLLFTILLLSLSLKAQETPPSGLVQVNSQFYLDPSTGAIWHQKGSPYGWERLARYSDLTAISGGILIPTAVKTGAYTAASKDFIPVNTTSASVTITLPTAPADKTQIGVKQIIKGGSNVVTIAAGGSDVFNKTGGVTSITLTLVNQGAILQYNTALGVWYVISDDLQLSGLDARYQAAGNYITSLTGDITAGGPGAAAATLATVNSNVGSGYNNFTVNAKGLITAASSVAYLTSNQNITLSGDFTGSGSTAITGTLATVNSNVGSGFNNFTVNGKGLITAASTVSYLTGNQTISITGDGTGSGSTSIPFTLGNVNSNVGSFGSTTTIPIITVNAKGLITAVSTATVPTGFTNPMTTSQDIIVGGTGGAAGRLGVGSNGNVLTVNGSGNVVWAAPSIGAVSSVNSSGSSLVFSPTTGSVNGEINYAHSGVYTVSNTTQINGITVSTSPTYAYQYINATAATSSVQQQSPDLGFSVQSWKSSGTAATNTANMWMHLTGANSGTAGQSVLGIYSNYNGSISTVATFGSDGTILLNGSVSGSNFSGSQFYGAVLVNITRSNLTNTVQDNYQAYNLQPSTSSVTLQNSGAYHSEGAYWNGTADAKVHFWQYASAVTGASGYGQYYWDGYAGTGTATPTHLMSLNTNGILGIPLSTGQTTLVAGTKAISITGVTTSNKAFLTFVSSGGTVSTTWQYSAVCTAGTLNITALTNTGSTDTSDTSTVNYWVVN